LAAAVGRALPRTDAGVACRVTATYAPVELGVDPSQFDAVVLGSPVYGDRWLEAARQYASMAAPSLQGRLVWLFSVGCTAAPATALTAPDEVSTLARLVQARGQRVLSGRVERRILSSNERAVLDGSVMPIGDMRDWSAVSAWCEDIAREIAATRVTSCALASDPETRPDAAFASKRALRMARMRLVPHAVC